MKRTQQRRLAIIFFLCLISIGNVFANVDTARYKFSVYGGGQAMIIEPSQFILLGNENEVLVPNYKRVTDFIGGFGAAYRFIVNEHKAILRYTHDVSTGLDVFYFKASQRGTALDFGSTPDFLYRLRIQSLRLMANAEWTFLPVARNRIYPFLQGGIGLALNTNHYADVPIPSAPTGVGIVFAKNAIAQVAYNAGLGLKWMPCDNIEMSFRYLYSNLGTVRSSNKTNLNVTDQYQFPLRTQSLLIGLSYLMQ